MLSRPVFQRALHGPTPQPATVRAPNTTEHQARLAGRLTARDRWLLRLLYEHRVLTADQITTLAWPSYRSGRQRLRELWQWSVLDRFAVRLASGGATPMHYVLGPAGAAVLAAEHGLDPRELGYRRQQATGIAYHQRLAHLIGVNDWFTALIGHAQHTSGTEVVAWWSESRCARHFGDLALPDGYGRWHHHPADPRRERRIEFFLEYDLGTERPATRVAAKLPGYAGLAAASGITTPLLIWLPTAHREARVRAALLAMWRGLDDPDAVPVATAAADLLDPEAAQPSPAEAIWLPLDPHALGAGRRGLAELAALWPAPPARPGSAGAAPRTASRGPGVLPPPHPMPPPAPSPRAPRPGG